MYLISHNKPVPNSLCSLSCDQLCMLLTLTFDTLSPMLIPFLVTTYTLSLNRPFQMKTSQNPDEMYKILSQPKPFRTSIPSRFLLPLQTGEEYHFCWAEQFHLWAIRTIENLFYYFIFLSWIFVLHVLVQGWPVCPSYRDGPFTMTIKSSRVIIMPYLNILSLITYILQFFLITVLSPHHPSLRIIQKDKQEKISNISAELQ